ncbi:SDR family oxidoreductase [Enterococcus saccharolyticus]|uniref:Short chain dehydrogenase/reductase family oxidoreductase n=1 Tax=Enterococcus saccharolyticus subsp. saccharolyticus ATCC 43076 TaxID=1139996 RepID=S0JPV8_9ENTE|nr:SDR family oxidoreductase [Enterococcus saccharolyticus]EOT30570.1 short chain dehydrogenase/reductase family oxidoreductase [Enterococcus saccharolyticus subsp. saccharolyticus ATCC 43076]EOT80131.1 short chain dehydrogenase/reductase family oxidoreductase [Enterococcus saccharolyticus subsp. saccharolyticus ATCC 43076]OJG87942.1 short chain dehydrogenase/reductase family oxidoreductase [Enterococcus saccharolyticus]
MSWLDIKGKTVIVTGGSSGIGAAIVKELCQLQVNVVNADLSEGNFSHDNLLFVQTDVTSRKSVEAVVEKAITHFGSIDGVVNNAGINIPALLVDEKQTENGKFEINDSLFDKIINVNQKGLYLMSQAVGRKLVEQGYGVIINMSSESGLEGSEGQSAYAATKAAVNSYTRSWAKELGKKGIRVVGIAPGIMEETGLRTLAYEEALAYTRGKTVAELRTGYSQTSTIPLGRSGKLSEVADLVAYFLSERSSYISGVTVNVAGGKTRG